MEAAPDFEALRARRNAAVQEMHQKMSDEWGVPLQSLRSNREQAPSPNTAAPQIFLNSSKGPPMPYLIGAAAMLAFLVYTAAVLWLGTKVGLIEAVDKTKTDGYFIAQGKRWRAVAEIE